MPSRARSRASAAMAFKPSASSTSLCACASTAGNKVATASPPPQPQTSTLVHHASGSVIRASGHSISSGLAASTSAAALPSKQAYTRPAPAAKAARAASSAAPRRPGAPPITSTSPHSPLWLDALRGVIAARQSAPSRRASPGCCATTPRSSNQSVPHCARPWAVNRPGLSVSRASVWVARTAVSPATAPVSASKPLGRSTARMGAARAFNCPIAAAITAFGARLRPRPSTASITSTVLGGVLMSSVMVTPANCAACKAARASAGCEPANRAIRTCRPARCKTRAATSPSPPLLPGPQTTQTVPSPDTANASLATASPARSINP